MLVAGIGIGVFVTIFVFGLLDLLLDDGILRPRMLGDFIGVLKCNLLF
jgi:hypothetical protein